MTMTGNTATIADGTKNAVSTTIACDDDVDRARCGEQATRHTQATAAGGARHRRRRTAAVAVPTRPSVQFVCVYDDRATSLLETRQRLPVAEGGRAHPGQARLQQHVLDGGVHGALGAHERDQVGEVRVHDGLVVIVARRQQRRQRGRAGRLVEAGRALDNARLHRRRPALRGDDDDQARHGPVDPLHRAPAGRHPRHDVADDRHRLPHHASLPGSRQQDRALLARPRDQVDQHREQHPDDKATRTQ